MAILKRHAALDDKVLARLRLADGERPHLVRDVLHRGSAWYLHGAGSKAYAYLDRGQTLQLRVLD